MRCMLRWVGGGANGDRVGRGGDAGAGVPGDGDAKVDTDARLRKAFENDWALTKIPKLVKDKEELERVKELLKGEYPRLKNMWLAMTCDSSYPNFSFNDYAVWCQSCKFLPKEGVSLADLDTA